MPERILLVDDDVAVIKSMARMLAGVGDIHVASSGPDALRILQDRLPSLILLDAEMPGMSGFRLCELLKSDPRVADIPVIFVTSHAETSVEVAGFEMGAVDFISKPVSPPLLLARVKTQLRIKQLTDELRRNAHIDGLTQVANRRSFDETLHREWQRGLRCGRPMSLLMVDVDHFKRFNDHYGHDAGDRCLRSVAQALAQACHRQADLVARYGGEEFVILLPATPRAGAVEVARHVLAAVDALGIAHAASPTAEQVTVSIGVSFYDEGSADWMCEGRDARCADDRSLPAAATKPASLLKAADLALYAAKQAGRARACMLDAAELDAPERASELQSAFA